MEQFPSGIEDMPYFKKMTDLHQFVAISRTEIYRRMKDDERELNPFPPSYHSRRHTKGGVFWELSDIRAWQLAEMGLAEPPYPNWPSLRFGIKK